MSQGGRSEHGDALCKMDGLRNAIARIEGDGTIVARFADDKAGRARTTVPLGAVALDRALRGGLDRGALHEVVAARPGDAGAASGFAMAVAARLAAALVRASLDDDVRQQVTG